MRAECEEICGRYPQRRAALLPLLRVAEREFGCVDLGAMRLVAEVVDVSPAHVWGVFSFYTHYRRPGTGRHLVQVCRTLPCELRGARAVWERLRSRLGVGDGETTPDGRCTLKRVECLGSCGTAPVVQVDDDYHEGLTPEAVDRLLAGVLGA
ncbi:MAG: NAD(P)H-dependent oxidoreductase subunit E [Planctomycetes bacterium]|nr:NAD(P)H-dependent oxidoreductase subunit E [Planctomycetota bacterium]